MSEVAALLPALAVLAPLVLAVLLVVPGARAAIGRLAPLAAVPALALAFAPDLGIGPVVIEAPEILLGLRLGATDTLARAFLAFTAVLWFVAAWFAHAYVGGQPRRTSFWAWFLVTMAGNLGVIVAQDMAGFYLLFAVMSLASYGLIVHDRTAAARRAANIYLAVALLGDVLILAALLAITPGAANLTLDTVPAAVAASPYAEAVAWLLLAGFGVKAGAVFPLHVWLPLAHPVAPTPASALLSGAMIKVGLLGWLRFLPIGELALPQLGTVWIVAGLTAAFGGAALGITHRDPKTVLAYSSISQMGMMMIGVGVAVSEPAARDVAIAALIVFASHHALAKAALFLGTAVARVGSKTEPAAAPSGGGRAVRWLIAIALVWPALEIAGAPLSSGALAKLTLKDVLALHPHGGALSSALSFAAIGSTLLMARFLAVIVPRGSAGASPSVGLWLPWVVLVAIDTVLFVRAGGQSALAAPGTAWSATWPVLAGAGIAVGAWRLGRGVRVPVVPAGDVVVLFAWLAGRGRALVEAMTRMVREAGSTLRGLTGTLASEGALARYGRWLDRVDAGLARFPVVGMSLVALAAALIVSSAR